MVRIHRTIKKKRGLNDPENYDDVATHLELNILEYEVKRALGSITINRVSGGDGIPAELLQILKDDTVKALHSLLQQKLSSGHRTGKGQFSFQSQRRATPKNAQTSVQLPSFHLLASSVQFSHSVMSDSLQPHESQHTRPPCPSPTPRVHSDSRPSSQ